MARARCWSITIHNYNDDEFDNYKKILSEHSKEFVIGKENGKNNCTPHLQIYVRFNDGKSMSSIKKLLNNETIHCEIARNGAALKNYCKKEGVYTVYTELNPEEIILETEYKDVKWKHWQEEILKLEPDRRYIHWYWDEHGNIGKSYLKDYLCLLGKACLVSNKHADSAFAIKEYVKNKKKCPEYLILDIPRSDNEIINYGNIEKLKGRVIFSSKFESGQFALLPNILVVFANIPPCKSKMSSDRWRIVNITATLQT